MRQRLAKLVSVLIAMLSVVAATGAEQPHQYSGPWFGDENWHPGCEQDVYPVDEDRGDWKVDLENTVCHHMRTDMNGLDSPQVDVLVLVPVSPTAERDMRIMTQSALMWEAGIDYVAQKMGLQWLADGMDFHISVEYVDANGPQGEFTTYPVVDPEIVIIASNPVGGIGIGIDPIDFGNVNGGQGLCHGVPNPLDFDFWESLPGFDSHHDERTGTYTEDCGGAGGNICFAINGAIDPQPGSEIDIFGLFDLVSHEVGHCLTIGHVGDGAEGHWGGTPIDDIMAYDDGIPSRTKCVSSLNVEGIATVMSRYLDVNGDGVLDRETLFEDGGDLLLANNQIGDGRDPFQVQHPSDHFYASITGEPGDCPQPDLGMFPGPRTNWTPEDGDDRGGR